MNLNYSFFKKWFPVILIALFLVCFFVFRLDRFLSYDAIRAYETTLRYWTDQHHVTAVLLFIFAFTVLIAATIPCATLMTLLGGFLFGTISILYSVIGTTLGGLVLLLAVRTSLGTHIAGHATGWVKRLEAGFQKNAFFYLLTLRLMPVAPCWISNVAAGALNVPIRVFIVATVLGVTPSTTIYALAGRGLDKIFSKPGPPDLSIILKPAIFVPLLGLALLSLLPVIYKQFIAKREP